MGEDWPAQQFEKNRSHLRGVAYRMLGSLNEADDAVQEAWLRLSRSDAGNIHNRGRLDQCEVEVVIRRSAKTELLKSVESR